MRPEEPRYCHIVVWIISGNVSDDREYWEMAAAVAALRSAAISAALQAA
jgi:hypothetical protein